MALAEEVNARTQNKILPSVGGALLGAEGLGGGSSPHTGLQASSSLPPHTNRDFSRELCRLPGFHTSQPGYFAKNVCLFWVHVCRVSPRRTLVPSVSKAWTCIAPTRYGEQPVQDTWVCLGQGWVPFKDTDIEVQEVWSLGIRAEAGNVLWDLGITLGGSPPSQSRAQGQVGGVEGLAFPREGPREAGLNPCAHHQAGGSQGDRTRRGAHAAPRECDGSQWHVEDWGTGVWVSSGFPCGLSRFPDTCILLAFTLPHSARHPWSPILA